MHMDVTDDDYERAANKALKRFPKEIWERMRGSLEDARQEAIVGAWKISLKDSSPKDQGAWLYRGAVSSLLDHYRKLKADHDKRSPTRVVHVGLDDVEAKVKDVEASLDHDSFPEQAVQGPDAEEQVQERELLAKLRLLLTGDLSGALNSSERWAVCEEYGLDVDVPAPKGVKQAQRKRLAESGLEKLRAEMRADEIMGL